MNVADIRKKIWNFENWCLWRWRGDMVDRGFLGNSEYSLFHECGASVSQSRDHRVATSDENGGQKYCVRCLKNAPDGAVAVLELMNWEI